MKRTKNSKIGAILISTFILLSAVSVTRGQANRPATRENGTVGQIYLYGEAHAEEVLLKKELEIWSDYYHRKQMRHLFVEVGYYTAAWLNLWMQADSDEILEAVFNDWKGTQSYRPVVKEFYREIKRLCPETLFHGTDVGHQYQTTGKRYLDYLEQNNLTDSEAYALTREAIEQGKYYYERKDAAYRENKMTENFIRAFDALEAESIMGIYGMAHTGLHTMNHTGDVPSMANQIRQHYGEIVRSEDLTPILKNIPPVRVDTLTVGGKVYKSSYFGELSLNFNDYLNVKYWRLENAYEDFKDYPLNGNVLPYDNYPMTIETGQVFRLEYSKTDGSIEIIHYRSDGNEWQNQPTTEEFTLENF